MARSERCVVSESWWAMPLTHANFPRTTRFVKVVRPPARTEMISFSIVLGDLIGKSRNQKTTFYSSEKVRGTSNHSHKRISILMVSIEARTTMTDIVAVHIIVHCALLLSLIQ
jgi:hypothetical protein